MKNLPAGHDQSENEARKNEARQDPVIPAKMPIMVDREQQHGHYPKRASVKLDNIPETRFGAIHADTSLRFNLRSWALTAQITVLADINTAPSAGVRIRPQGKKIPAAAGMANAL